MQTCKTPCILHADPWKTSGGVFFSFLFPAKSEYILHTHRGADSGCVGLKCFQLLRPTAISRFFRLAESNFDKKMPSGSTGPIDFNRKVYENTYIYMAPIDYGRKILGIYIVSLLHAKSLIICTTKSSGTLECY